MFNADSIQRYAGNRFGRILTWLKDTIVIFYELQFFPKFPILSIFDTFLTGQKTECKIKMTMVSLKNLFTKSCQSRLWYPKLTNFPIQLNFWSQNRKPLGGPPRRVQGLRMVQVSLIKNQSHWDFLSHGILGIFVKIRTVTIYRAKLLSFKSYYFDWAPDLLRNTNT